MRKFWDKTLVTITFTTLLASMFVVSGTTQANAATWKPFSVGFNTQINGGVVFAQNTSLTCSSRRSSGTVDANGCTAAKTGKGNLRENNDWIMTHVDIDSDPSTFNSSSSTLRLSTGSRVKYAALYWGARLRGANNQPNVTIPYDRVKLKVPGRNDYVDVVAAANDVFTATTKQSTTLPYQAKADVTSLVASAGSGVYTVANLPAALGSDRYGGWTLAVVFEDPSKPLRDITLFDGFLSVSSSSAVSIDTIRVDGFRAPVAGAVDATAGIMAYDGDRDSTGDYANFNGARLSSPLSPGSNYFNSTIEVFGSSVTGLNPSDNNTFGYDVKVADATGLIPNSATSASIDVATYGEAVYVGLISTRIDLTAPNFPSIKSVDNLNNNYPALPGDTLRYKMVFNNVGDDPADSFVVSDKIPTGTTYVPGSLKINAASVSDGIGDDTGEYDAASQTLFSRLGQGATSSQGGRIDIDATATVTFEVVVQESARGTSINNSADLSYRAVTLKENINAVTNTATFPVVGAPTNSETSTDDPRLEIEVVVPDRVPDGETVEKDIVVDNPTDTPARDVVVDVTLDDSTEFVSADDDCVNLVTVIRCSTPEIPANGQDIFTIVVRVDEGASKDSSIGMSITASSSNISKILINDKDTTSVSVNADLRLLQRFVGDARPGSRGQYRYAVRNLGPSRATKVTITEVLPKGVTLLPTKGCTANKQQPRLVVCSVKNLKEGELAVISMAVRLPSNVSRQLTNRAIVGYSGVDRRPANNSASLTIGWLPATR